MDADDKRHGSTAGHQAHLRDHEPACPPCVAAKSRYEKARHLYGNRMVPALGTRRRIQALMALGHSGADIGRRLGVTYQSVHKYERDTAELIFASTAEKVARVYDEMSMTLPTSPHQHRIRKKAAARGYAPPLAFDCIDTDPHPRGIRDNNQQYTDRRELLTEMVDRGDGLTTICRALNITPGALHMWCSRNQMRDTWARLSNREGDWNSPYRLSREGAA
jgi:transcriptional regulator with XRE-family HTH domain